ncbi:hypothetical protein LNP74_11120 [Klebsiella pneumoniae subsp. pneumoniae]|nr:hypothetical protein [Klebsiella pneumoniae subsp. pneumoniae]
MTGTKDRHSAAKPGDYVFGLSLKGPLQGPAGHRQRENRRHAGPAQRKRPLPIAGRLPLR